MDEFVTWPEPDVKSDNQILDELLCIEEKLQSQQDSSIPVFSDAVNTDEDDGIEILGFRPNSKHVFSTSEKNEKYAGDLFYSKT